MIRRIEALRYRCLAYLSQQVSPFQILVGPNASGKSTFLDTIRFLSQLVSDGLESAIGARTSNLDDLMWMRRRGSFQLAVEASIPAELRKRFAGTPYDVCRYEVEIGTDGPTGENHVLSETVLLAPDEVSGPRQRTLFPDTMLPPSTLRRGTPLKGTKTVVNKLRDGRDNFYSEHAIGARGWHTAFQLGPRKSALANLPEDETRFPVAAWMKGVLINGVDSIVLDSANMRRPSPPGMPRRFRSDGSNLPWVIENLRTRNPSAFESWVAHVRTALPDVRTVETIERPEDRHRYLQVAYGNDLRVPAWGISDGTLRLLALTLLAYAGDAGRIYLIEEPENGIHPQAVETVFQSLSSAYDCQVFCATHSSVVLALAEPSQVLCFARTSEGSTDVVRGDVHPNLQGWRRDTDLGTLFAAGVLG